jgi:uncharacterized protein YkwD
MAEVEVAAQRLGIVEPVIIAARLLGERSDAQTEAELARILRVPDGFEISNVGVDAARSVEGWAEVVVMSVREVQIDPFPRAVQPGETLEIRGEAAQRFSKTRLSLTLPSGKSVERTAGRSFSFHVPTPMPGTYGVEVFGDGSTGPVVILNVNVYAGIPEPTAVSTAKSGDLAPPAVLESRLLALVNEERAQARLRALEPDSDLARVALGHSEDMKANNFVGHVSKTTGTVFDRARAARIRATKVGENVAMANSVEAVHQMLMSSPGHRAIILSGAFTRAGVGLVVGEGDGTGVMLYATEVFADR